MQVLSESARWMRKHDDQPDLLCVRGKALYGTGQLEQARCYRRCYRPV